MWKDVTRWLASAGLKHDAGKTELQEYNGTSTMRMGALTLVAHDGSTEGLMREIGRLQAGRLQAG